MDEITSIVKDYLNQNNTDYAIFINGVWGSGKTYYVKNCLIPEINKFDFPSDNGIENKKFEPVYISLFGLSNEYEFYEKLVVELNPKLKSKGLFWFNKAINKVSGITGIDGFSQEDAKDYISVYKIPVNKVLFFDDLERINHGYLSKVLGLINAFVEHQYVKTIIIGDESIILKDSCNHEATDEYKKIKEKLIRFTYNFERNISDVYENVSSSFDDAYKEFLQSKKSLICGTFLKGDDRNLRTLKFILDIFQKIYNLEGLNKEKKYYEEIINRFLYFSTVYSIEYKKGIENEELDELKLLTNRFYPLLNVDLSENDNNNGTHENEKQYKDLFTEKYFNDKEEDYRFEFCNAIAGYIHNGFLKVPDLIAQAEKIKDELFRNEGTRESEIINKLGNILILEDDELESLIEETLDKVVKGDFDLITYPNIFSYFVKLDFYKLGNVSINNDELYSKFKQGVDISKKRSEYNPSFRSQIPIWSYSDPDAKSKYQKIADYAIEANESIRELNIKVHADTILSLFNDSKIDELYQKIVDVEYRLTPVFSYISPKDFFKKMQSSTNQTLNCLYLAISERYSSTSIDHKIVNERPFFDELSNLIKNYLKSEDSASKTIKNIWFEKILQFINEIIERLETAKEHH